MHMTRIRLVVGMAVAALCAPFIVMATAAADDGDGYLSCDRYELCYSQDYPASYAQKDFYNSGNDSGNYFTWVNTGSSGASVLNRASSMDNLDTQCWVRVVDWNSNGTSMLAYQDFGNHPSSSYWVGFSSRMNDHNDAHLRCGHY
ncbi:MAG: hypothetical protein QOG80_3147 [Pseudonocardiales bacterium]|jgi:hypothetical protein|nr:hypothetical protein [Pseudonocardiales bacterium]